MSAGIGSATGSLFPYVIILATTQDTQNCASEIMVHQPSFDKSRLELKPDLSYDVTKRAARVIRLTSSRLIAVRTRFAGCSQHRHFVISSSGDQRHLGFTLTAGTLRADADQPNCTASAEVLKATRQPRNHAAVSLKYSRSVGHFNHQQVCTVAKCSKVLILRV